jgi:hypothetical protein
MDLDKAVETQITNIEKKTGKTRTELRELALGWGLEKHGQIRDRFKADLGLGHGDANSLTHFVLASDGARQAEGKEEEDVLAEIYSGTKAALRPIHEALMAEIGHWGDFEVHPKKGYVSLRRKKQFVMLGPATATRFEVGINMKGVPGTERLVEQPAGGMCQYKVKLTSVEEVDAEVFGWIKAAYEAAG